VARIGINTPIRIRAAAAERATAAATAAHDQPPPPNEQAAVETKAPAVACL
jgi:hypothetical protein